jgi:hypothetical protein
MTEHSLKKPYLITISKEKKYRVREKLHSQVMTDGQTIFQNRTLFNSLQRFSLSLTVKTTQIVFVLKPHQNIACCVSPLHTPRIELPTYLHTPPPFFSNCILCRPPHAVSNPHIPARYPYVLARCSIPRITKPYNLVPIPTS